MYGPVKKICVLGRQYFLCRIRHQPNTSDNEAK